MKREIKIERSSKYSIDVEGDFQFDSVTPPGHGSRQLGRIDRAAAKEAKKQAKKDKKEANSRKKEGLPPVEPKKKVEEGIPFSLRDINLQIPRGESSP